MKFADEVVRVLLDASPDAIVIHHQDGSIESVNTQVENWFGYNKEELVGHPLEILIPERFRIAHITHRMNYARTPIPRPMGTGLDLFARRKDKSEFPVDISIGPMKVGNDLYFICNIRDITEKKRIETERLRAIQSKEKLLGMITHDLKNPLSAIIMCVQHVPTALNTTNPEVQKILQTIRTAADNMYTLIQDILTFQKSERGTLSLYKQLYEVNTIVNPILEIIAPIALRKSIDLKAIILPRDLKIFCDKNRISQAISNLLNNAIKFTPEGGSVQLQVKPVLTGVEFSVSDTGEGISEKDVSHLFEEFWQAKKTSKLGTGLGLSIVKTIVQAHGGQVGVKSEPEKGSEFFFILPSK